MTRKSAVDSAQPFQRVPDIVARRIAGEYILVPIRGRLADLRRIYALNPAAACMWEALAGGAQTTAALVDAVVASFAIGPEEAARDVDEFLGELLREGLVTTVEAP